MSPRVALATCAELPKGDEDAPLLEGALRANGIEPSAVVWDDPEADWASFDLVTIRSTWDFTDRHEAFVAWASSLPRVLNPAAVVAWNTQKTYMADLAAAGVPTVGTTVLAPGEAFVAPGDGDWVVKPSISVGSRDATRFVPGQEREAAREVKRLHGEGRSVLVQPFVASVDDRGETAVLFLGGAFSHSVVKGPMLTPGRALVDALYFEEDIGPRGVTDAERAVAERALAAVPGGAEQLLYARVDVVEGAGGPEVLELELAEPSMFLARPGRGGAVRGRDRGRALRAPAHAGPSAASRRRRRRRRPPTAARPPSAPSGMSSARETTATAAATRRILAASPDARRPGSSRHHRAGGGRAPARSP